MKILSLDGGGSWAVIQVLALENIYGDAATGFEVLKHYDLAIANSGGSIVLAGLMLDMRLSDIFLFFMDEKKRRAIFAERTLGILGNLTGVLPKYSTAKKRDGLLAAMGNGGNRALSAFPGVQNWPAGPAGAPVKCAIVSFNYDQLRAEFFRTYKPAAASSSASAIPLVDAVNASTDAPIRYFDAPAECDGHRYWDGAMGGYNNPVMAGVVEAIAAVGVAPASIHALTIGTGTVRLARFDVVPDAPAPMKAKRVTPSIVHDAKQAAACLLDDPPDAATYTAHIVLGHAPDAMGSVVRMNPVVRPMLAQNRWALPPGLNEGQFSALADLDMDAVKQPDMDLIVHLAKAWLSDAVPNQPIRFDPKTLGGAPGDDTFSAAKHRWSLL